MYCLIYMGTNPNKKKAVTRANAELRPDQVVKVRSRVLGFLSPTPSRTLVHHPGQVRHPRVSCKPFRVFSFILLMYPIRSDHILAGQVFLQDVSPRLDVGSTAPWV